MQNKQNNLSSYIGYYLQVLFEVASFKESPLKLPYSKLILYFMIAISIFLRFKFSPFEPARALLIASNVILLNALIIYLVLSFYNKNEHYVKVFSFFTFAEVLMNIIVLFSGGAIITLFAAIIWYFAINTYVYRKVLSCLLAESIVIVITSYIAHFILIRIQIPAGYLEMSTM